MVTVTSAAVDGAVGLDESLPHALMSIDAPVATITSRRNEYGFTIGSTPLHSTVSIGASGVPCNGLSFLRMRLIVSFESGQPAAGSPAAHARAVGRGESEMPAAGICF